MHNMMTQKQIAELVDKLRAAEREADSIDPGCRLAVLFGQAHRSITQLWVERHAREASDVSASISRWDREDDIVGRSLRKSNDEKDD